MPATANDDEALAELLGEALRRGPGSPEWHDALIRLRETHETGGDESQLLLTARERLANGREYRSVRAGPAFTEAVFTRLDAPPADSRSRALRVVAVVSAAVILICAAALIIATSRSRPADGQALAEQLFIAPLHQYGFLRPNEVGIDLDKSWHVDRGTGLRPSAPVETQRLDLPKPIDLTRPVCVECVVVVSRKTDTKVGIVATGGGGTGPRAGVEIHAGGINATRGSEGVTSLMRGGLNPKTYVLRLKLTRDYAIIEVDGRVVANGPLTLGDFATLAIEFAGVSRDVQAVRVEAVRVLGVDPSGATQ